VSIIGSGGAGKSTLARKLGEVLHLPVIHLDALFWRPGWTETPKPEWRARVEELVRSDAWIMDGNYGGTMDIRLPASDTVIFMDYPPTVCMLRALRRWATHRTRTRPDMAEGCNEKVDLEFLGWIWRFRSRTRPRIERHLAALDESIDIIRLASPSQTEAFLGGLPK
jgi:adenylate kinase family enzyme